MLFHFRLPAEKMRASARVCKDQAKRRWRAELEIGDQKDDEEPSCCKDALGTIIYFGQTIFIALENARVFSRNQSRRLGGGGLGSSMPSVAYRPRSSCKPPPTEV